MPVVVMGGACSHACDFIRGQRVARPSVRPPDGAWSRRPDPGPLHAPVLIERLRRRHIAEDDELDEAFPHERLSDLTRHERKIFKKQHERHLAESAALMHVIFTEET